MYYNTYQGANWMKKQEARGPNLPGGQRKERQDKKLGQSKLSDRSNVPLDTLRSIENGRVLSLGLFIAADLVYALNGRLDDCLKSKKKRKA